MNSIAIRSGLAVMVLGVLTACAGAATVQPANITAAYEPRLLQYIASRGGLPTEVSGNPFDSADEQVGGVVRRTMERSHFGPDFPFLAEKPQGFVSPYRMVVALSATASPAYFRLCSDPRTGDRGKANGGEVRVAAALCAGDSMVTGTAGRVSGVRTPEDPAFVSLIAQVTQELFPLRDQQDRDPVDIIVP